MNVNQLILSCLLIAGAVHFKSVEANIEDALGAFINIVVGQRPNNENGTASQFKEKALNDKSNVEIYDSTSQVIIERSGFKQKTYEVVSDDGYITQVINIINPKADRTKLKRPPVILSHGGLTDTSAWMLVDAIEHHPEKYPRTASDGPITSSNRSMAFMLCNNGYDVWLMGTRGSNKQNLGHIKYKARFLTDLLADVISNEEESDTIAREFVDTLKYFDYSMDELVDYEYPKQIETIVELSGSDKVTFVAMSFGTPIAFKLLCSNKAISKRIHNYVALLPLLNTKGTSRLVALAFKLLPKIPIPLGTIVTQIILSQPVRDFLRKLDRYGLFKMITTLVFGSSAKYQTDLEDAAVGHVFLSTGFKEVQHFAQEVQQARLQKFDYGPAKNLFIYGSHDPPVYDLSQFKTKHWMIATSGNDILGPPASGDQYVSMIKVKPYKHLNIPGWNHADMVAAFDNDIKINFPVLDFLEKTKLPRKRKIMDDDE